ncbi:hypothetical protein ACQ5SP_16040 [Rhodovulum sp. YNF3179]|uniref:hypothetical protein n=1 Tax=Rhodovulum sp. YNF3179 TaxID=3425127 RepID=UPI003D335447
MSPENRRLEAALLAAHATGDAEALVTLYFEAGRRAEARAEIDAACFFYTYAYVYALEHGHGDAHALHARLKAYGREE